MEIIGLYASSKCDRQPGNNHCFSVRQQQHKQQSEASPLITGGGNSSFRRARGAFCISSDILQQTTDVKLAIGNWAGWK